MGGRAVAAEGREETLSRKLAECHAAREGLYQEFIQMRWVGKEGGTKDKERGTFKCSHVPQYREGMGERERERECVF